MHKKKKLTQTPNPDPNEHRRYKKKYHVPANRVRVTLSLWHCLLCCIVHMSID